MIKNNSSNLFLVFLLFYIFRFVHGRNNELFQNEYNYETSIVLLRESCNFIAHIESIAEPYFDIFKRDIYDDITGNCSIDGSADVYWGKFSEEAKIWLGYNGDVVGIYEDKDIGTDYSESADDINEEEEEISVESLPEIKEDYFESSMSYYHNRTEFKSPEGIYAFLIDSGVNIMHHELKHCTVYGENYVTNEGPEDLRGHGTHVAGIIGSKRFGIKNITLVSVKVLDRYGVGKFTAILSALGWIGNLRNYRGKAVINMSLTIPSAGPVLSAVQKALSNNGFILVGAVGNSARNACHYNPGENYKNMITVGNVMQQDSKYFRSRKSNFGKCVRIWAPGTRILSTTNKLKKYKYLSGTSQAAPQVTKLAAYLLKEGVYYKCIGWAIEYYSIKNFIYNLTEEDSNLLWDNSFYRINTTYIIANCPNKKLE